MVFFISSHEMSANIRGVGCISASSRVPKCGIRLSGSVASVFFFRCVRERTNKRQAGNSGALMRYLLNYELNMRSVYDDEKQLCCTITMTKTKTF